MKYLVDTVGGTLVAFGLLSWAVEPGLVKQVNRDETDIVAMARNRHIVSAGIAAASLACGLAYASSTEGRRGQHVLLRRIDNVSGR